MVVLCAGRIPFFSRVYRTVDPFIMDAILLEYFIVYIWHVTSNYCGSRLKDSFGVHGAVILAR